MTSARERSVPFSLVAFLFTASGASGLVFEVIWVKALTLVVGHTTLAVSVVVSAFLAGLVLGSVVFGRWADRVSRPLLGYGLLEVVTGMFALGLTALLPSLELLLTRAGLPGGGPLWLRAILVFALIVLPTSAMGGTLPMLTRALSREAEHVGRSFGWLYTLNTLGAAVGCALTGFVLIGALGMLRTALLAAVVNVLIGALAFLLDRWRGAETRTAGTGTPEPSPAPELLRARRALITAFALSGFASIAYEVLWFRVLSTFLSATSYAFTLMLVVFLLGLVLGGVIYGWRISRHPRPMDALVACQSALAFAALASMLILGQGRLVSGLAVLIAGRGYTPMMVHAGLVMLVPTTLIGICFPLTIQLTARHLDRLGSDVGLLYSVNTLGGILGSLITGLVLIPWLGTQTTFAAMTAVNMAVALFLQRFNPHATRAGARSLIASAALLLMGAVALPSSYLIRALPQRDEGKVLDVREGRDGTAIVLEYTRQSMCGSGKYRCDATCTRDFSYRQLVFGQISYASTVLSDRRYMRALAHLPMLLHRDPKRALEICFGTGTTAAAFASYPGLEWLRIVDINPDVIALAPHFEDSNHRVLQDPRTHVAVEDGRHFLLASEERFDVVSLEPPPPIDAGVVNLYSREFYAQVRSRLRPGGILAQWLPVEQQNTELDKRLIAAALAEFPHVSLWMGSRLEAVLIASDAPLQVDLDAWKARQSATASASLAEVGFTPESLLGTYVMGTEALRRYVGNAPPVTDDRPAIEYFLSYPGPAFDVAPLFAMAQKPSALIPSQPDDVRARVDRDAEAAKDLTWAHILNDQRDVAGARAKVDAAQALLGQGPFLEHMRSVEYGCMERK